MFSINPVLLAFIILVILVLIVYIIIWVVRAHQQQVSAGREELVGKTALVEIALAPKGVVLVEGERWTAIVDNGPVEPEEEVTITKVEGLKLRVTKKQ